MAVQPVGPFVEAQRHHATTVRQLRERLAQERAARIRAELRLERVTTALMARHDVPLALMRDLGVDPGSRAA